MLGPELTSDRYVFCQVEQKDAEVMGADCLGVFQEERGATLILSRQLAEENDLDYEFVFRKITLNVYSSLEAVGLLAEVTRTLAAEGIAVNVVSGHDHDHLFVLDPDAEQALRVLENLSELKGPGQG